MKNVIDKSVYDVFNEYFNHIPDERQTFKIKHLLNEILFISVLAVISGADDFEEIEQYGKEKYKWLKTFLVLPEGIPSHDTFNRVLCMIDPKKFQQSFIDWVSDIRNSIPIPENKDVVSIDGKTICNSHDKRKGKKAIHMVSALSSEYGLILGQRKCAEKSNEITAIPELLDMLYLAGTVITIDAMGCQKNIASKIIDKGADYLLALKGNQGNLYKEVIEMFERVKKPEFKKYIYQEDTEEGKDHGRIEKRHCITINKLDWLYEVHAWKDIKSIVKIISTVFKDGKETVEERYYISSLTGNANFINRAVRKHWYIENKLHWILDVIFKEDYCRIRTGNGAENFNTVRKIAINTIKRDTSEKGSLKKKRKKASWNDAYAMKIMNSMKA